MSNIGRAPRPFVLGNSVPNSLVAPYSIRVSWKTKTRAFGDAEPKQWVITLAIDDTCRRISLSASDQLGATRTLADFPTDICQCILARTGDITCLSLGGTHLAFNDAGRCLYARSDLFNQLEIEGGRSELLGLHIQWEQ